MAGRGPPADANGDTRSLCHPVPAAAASPCGKP